MAKPRPAPRSVARPAAKRSLARTSTTRKPARTKPPAAKPPAAAARPPAAAARPPAAAARPPAAAARPPAAAAKPPAAAAAAKPPAATAAAAAKPPTAAAAAKPPAAAAKPPAATAKPPAATAAAKPPAAAARPPAAAARPPAAAAAAKPPADPARPFANQRWAFFGEFAIWPGYHGTSPAGAAESRGAVLADTVDDQLDVLVLGDRRGTGRAEAKTQAAKRARAGRLQILDEAAYRERVRIDLAGKRFAFAGGFDCSPDGLEAGLLTRMVEATGAVVTDDLDPALDYLVLGNRRGPRKIAIANQVARRIADGAPIVLLDETTFLELVRVDRPASDATGLDFAGFLSRLYGDVDHGKLGRALDMLRKDRFSLYARLDADHVVGIVRSQRSAGSVYASWLTHEGHYGCAQPTLEDCMGLQGAPCKHLLVLVVGLARTGQLAMPTALAWLHAASAAQPRKNDALCAETFLQYKGAEAGELDWRPTETIPEDFYAL